MIHLVTDSFDVSKWLISYWLSVPWSDTSWVPIRNKKRPSSDHLTWLSWTWARAGTGVEGTCHWPSGPVWSLTHTGSPASCSSALTWWSEWDGYSPGTSSSPPSPGSAVCSPAPPSGSGSAAGVLSPGPPPRPASSGTPVELVEAETEQGWAGERFEQRLALDGESPPPTLPVS